MSGPPQRPQRAQRPERLQRAQRLQRPQQPLGASSRKGFEATTVCAYPSDCLTAMISQKKPISNIALVKCPTHGRAGGGEEKKRWEGGNRRISVLCVEETGGGGGWNRCIGARTGSLHHGCTETQQQRPREPRGRAALRIYTDIYKGAPGGGDRQRMVAKHQYTDHLGQRSGPEIKAQQIRFLHR